MIESITIRNFQKHRKLHLKLGPVTTIVGPNDSGKSALIRALTWVLTNKPNGSAFMSHGMKRVLVKVSMDGHVLVRSKGKGNTYKLDGAEFKAFGKRVPDEISNLVAMDDLNIQGQYDAPGFWFSLSPGEVSRRLNSIVDLGIIDSTLANLTRELRKAFLERTICQDRLMSATQDVRKLRGTVEAARELNALDASTAEADALGHKRASLASLLTDIAEQQLEAERLSSLDAARSDLEALEALQARAEEAYEKVSALEDVLCDVRRERKRCRDLKKDLKHAKKLFHEAIGDSCPLCGVILS